MQTKLLPSELVTIVNALYDMMDSCFNKYDVDKIESVRDTLMVSSGIAVKSSPSTDMEKGFSTAILFLVTE